jgi:hypothetical protein
MLIWHEEVLIDAGEQIVYLAIPLDWRVGDAMFNESKRSLLMLKQRLWKLLYSRHHHAWDMTHINKYSAHFYSKTKTHITTF